ncbi:MAG: hypothetical protein HYU78_08695 [Rhodocyclales bacterium]|nr:hypothetical protein [Rhodocyclales bacterium]
MNPVAVYVRTDKGAEEVAHRSQAIPSRARSLLMLIDGKASGAQLLDKFASYPNAAEFLQLLEDSGYIEALAGSAASAAGPAATVAIEPGLAEAKRLLVQTLLEVFGPDADQFTGKVDNARSLAELRVLGEKYRDLIADFGKRKKSEAFWQQFEPLLPAA